MNRKLTNGPSRHFQFLIILGLLTLLPLHSLHGQVAGLHLNDLEYFDSPGFQVLAFENAYTGFFFDEKTSGIMFIHHGVRTATGGAVRLKPTPEQWDQIPLLVDRKVYREENRVEVILRYEEFDFESKLEVSATETGLRFRVFLEKPLPERLKGRAGLNLEFLPTAYFGKTYLADDKPGIFPLHPSDSMQVLPAETQLTQFAGHSTFDDRGRGEYVEPDPFSRGRRLWLSPEDPETSVRIEEMTGKELLLLDGRNVAQNGWYVVRTLIPSGSTGKVIEWNIEPTVLPGWKRTPVIAHSQVGYHPDQEKVAVIEIDQNDIPLSGATLLKLNDQGTWEEAWKGKVETWGNFYRYAYLRFDFTQITSPGIYSLMYGNQQSTPFPIGDHIYDHGWQPTLDVWFPVQMDHMTVNEAYRVWHGTAHLDDARQAPIDHQHFDGYSMGDTTETRYAPGEHIPGLNIGGWFDAGDFDIRTGSHCTTVLSLVESWERFGLTRDQTLVEKAQRFVDIHHPDGTPDLLQQIEHGTLALIAQHRAFGRAIPGIIVPNLHQYHHLGDGSTMTDNLLYDPQLKPYESNCTRSGTPDDRWAFTTRSAMNSYASISALAAAGRALRGTNDELSDECIRTAIRAWKDEQNHSQEPDRFAELLGGSGEIQAALQLYITTGEDAYREEFMQRIWTALDKSLNRNMQWAVQAVPFLDAEYREQLIPYVKKYREFNESLTGQNPYGVPITARGWAGNETIINWAITNYLLNRSFPGIIGPEYTYRGIDYIYGCHPYSDVSFVSGVGIDSKRVAYGNNRADYSFIAGGVVPGVLVIPPDYPEHKNDWPFLWGENEYVINICAEYIFLVNAVLDLGN